jgi:hypothetical protein
MTRLCLACANRINSKLVENSLCLIWRIYYNYEHKMCPNTAVTDLRGRWFMSYSFAVVVCHWTKLNNAYWKVREGSCRVWHIRAFITLPNVTSLAYTWELHFNCKKVVILLAISVLQKLLQLLAQWAQHTDTPLNTIQTLHHEKQPGI